MDYIAYIRRDTGRLLTAAPGHLDQRVRACPDWDVFTLVRHLGEVHRFWQQVVAGRLTQPPGSSDHPLQAPSRMTVLEWLDAGAEQLCHTLASTAPDVPVWTWFPPDRTAGFVRRRMAHETAVHRWDAQHAAGTAEPIEPELATDGIAEYFDVFVAERGSYAGPAGSLHVHCTDSKGEWTVRLEPGHPRVEQGHTEADAALRGPASAVLLVLWERLTVDDVESFGEQALIGALLDYVDTT